MYSRNEEEKLYGHVGGNSGHVGGNKGQEGGINTVAIVNVESIGIRQLEILMLATVKLDVSLYCKYSSESHHW